MDNSCSRTSLYERPVYCPFWNRTWARGWVAVVILFICAELHHGSFGVAIFFFWLLQIFPGNCVRSFSRNSPKGNWTQHRPSLPCGPKMVNTTAFCRPRREKNAPARLVVVTGFPRNVARHVAWQHKHRSVELIAQFFNTVSNVFKKRQRKKRSGQSRGLLTTPRGGVRGVNTLTGFLAKKRFVRCA